MVPLISKITIYPLKSFDGIDLEYSHILPSGALENDRRLALLDDSGNYFNAKRYPEIHQFECQFHKDWFSMVMSLPSQSKMEFFDLRTDGARLVSWVSQFCTKVTAFEKNTEAGLPDDRNANGPTLISHATLELVASWFDGMTIHDIRRRLRPNIEIEGVPAFWEDQLFASTIPFSIASVQLVGSNPCQRCVVPTRCPDSGSVLNEFSDTVRRKRKELIPEWSDPSRFDHYYKLATNTKLAQGSNGGSISLGDELILPTN